jgi:hypothetical protein
VTELSSYVFSPLREGEFTLYRGAGAGLDPILLVEPVAEYSARESLKRLEHEYSLRDALDPDWAARPIALARRGGRMVLVLEDPGGAPIDRLLGQPLPVTQFLRVATPLAAALSRPPTCVALPFQPLLRAVQIFTGSASRYPASRAHEGTMARLIAYIQAAWHTEITDHCKEAFLTELARHGYAASDVQFFSAPGSLEIPLMAKRLAKTGRYAAVCASGLVIDGGIYRHEFVVASRASGHRPNVARHRYTRAVRGADSASFSRARRPPSVLQGAYANEGRRARASLCLNHREPRRRRNARGAWLMRSSQTVAPAQAGPD